ncbi:NAD(+) synthase, partial [Patescibacteria group bacterium]|nr:NAD(+) synthase [Patescibacteria group bacterium]
PVLKDVLKKTKHEKVILGISGGIDSTTSLYLLKKSIPLKNIILAHLYYFEPLKLDSLIKDISQENVHFISIKEIVDALASQLKVNLETAKVRFGNIAARARMIILYDLSKKYNAIVAGTENKSEYYLGYFTRFGDEASDFEPIRHLYKTQVYELAKYLKVPEKIINRPPTAGLWKGQTDERELGFTYKETDQVLYFYFERNQSLEEIKNKGFKNADKILERVLKNKYKHSTPYSIS